MTYREESNGLNKVRAELRKRCSAGDLPEWITELKEILEIKPGGTMVSRGEKSFSIYPIWEEPHIDSFSYMHAASNLGVYNIRKDINNVNVLQINSNEGRTYILRKCGGKVEAKIIKALQEAGYEKKEKLHVDLLRGEKIL